MKMKKQGRAHAVLFGICYALLAIAVNVALIWFSPTWVRLSTGLAVAPVHNALVQVLTLFPADAILLFCLLYHCRHMRVHR